MQIEWGRGASHRESMPIKALPHLPQSDIVNKIFSSGYDFELSGTHSKLLALLAECLALFRS